MRDSPEGGELDPAANDRRFCSKNSPSFYPALVRGQKRLWLWKYSKQRQDSEGLASF